MNDHVYKHIELTGSSTVGSDQAIQNAISKAAKSIKKYALVSGGRNARLY